MCGGAWCLGELCVPEDGSVCPVGGGFCVLGILCPGADVYLWVPLGRGGSVSLWGGSLSEGMEGRGWEGLYIHIQSTLEQRRD